MHNITEKEKIFYENARVDGRQMNAMAKLANALTSFEPLANRPGVGEKTADELVSLGLAERGSCDEPWPSRGYPIGYRLTNLGWLIQERGKFPKKYSA